MRLGFMMRSAPGESCESMRASPLLRALFALFAMFGALVLQTVPGQAETRSLSFKQVHTGETLSVVYKKNGRYIPEAMAKINYILRDWRRNETIRMDPRLIDTLWEAHKRTGSKAPIHVLSGYRSPVTNAMLRSRSRGVAKSSQHTLGKATDFFIPGVKLATLRETGLKMENGGVGYYPRSGSPFVHLDVGNVRYWPRMTRSQLAKVFPKGDTVLMTRDGKTMPKYSVAKARIDAKRSRATPVYASLTAGPSSTPARSRGGRNDDVAGTAGGGVRVSPEALVTDRGEQTPRRSLAETVLAAATPETDAPDEPEAETAAENAETGSETTLASVPMPSRRPETAPVQLAALNDEAPEPAVAAVPLPTPVARTQTASLASAEPAQQNGDPIGDILRGDTGEAQTDQQEPVRTAMVIDPSRIRLPEAKPVGAPMSLTGTPSTTSSTNSLTALIPVSRIDDPIAKVIDAAPEPSFRQKSKMIAPDFGSATVSAMIRSSAVTRSAESATAAWRIESAFEAFGMRREATPQRPVMNENRFTGPAVRVYEPARAMSFRAAG